MAATAFKAVQRNARISERKTRLCADLIRGKRVEDALNILEFDRRRGSFFVRKVLISAIANAQNRAGADPMDLEVKDVFVDKGIVLQRFHPSGRGRMHGMQRRCCHITVAVAPAAGKE